MTDYLFSQPSFFSGVARVLDLWGNFPEYNTSVDGEEADAISIYNDWKSIGSDLKSAITQVAEEQNSK